MRWFGEPWPSARMRAPVCADDADRMPIPVGATCLQCGRQIDADARGVEIGHMDADGTASARCWHLRCFMESVLPPAMVAEVNRVGRLWPEDDMRPEDDTPRE